MPEIFRHFVQQSPESVNNKKKALDYQLTHNFEAEALTAA